MFFRPPVEEGEKFVTIAWTRLHEDDGLEVQGSGSIFGHIAQYPAA
jgi:hypothetical protein